VNQNGTGQARLDITLGDMLISDLFMVFATGNVVKSMQLSTGVYKPVYRKIIGL